MPAFQKVARLLVRHLDGILAYRHEAYCYEKVPFGMVEAINGNIRALLRRGRGYRDHEYLRLKVQKATAERRRLLRTAMNAGHVTDSREDGVFTPASNGEVRTAS